MGTVANLSVRISANTSDFEKGVASLEKSLDKTGSKFQSIGSKLTQGLTLPIIAVAGGAIKAAVDFEDAFSGVAKTVDGVADSKGKMTAFGRELQESFRALAKTIPVSVNELAKIGEVAGAMGIPKESLLDFSTVMAKIGATTNVTSDQAAASIGKIQNVYQAAGVDTDRFASSLVGLGNAGASTEAQILAFAERMGGAAVQANVSQAEVLGWANAMASVGVEAELGSTAWNKTMSSIGVAVDLGSAKLDAFAAVAGMTSASFSNLFKSDASEAMNRVVEGFGRIKESGGNVTATMNELGMQTAGIQMTFKNLAGAGDMVRQSLDLGKKAWQENKAMEEEFAKKAATTSSILKVLYNNLYDVAISFGQQLIPHMMRLIPAIQSVTAGLVAMVGWFSHLPQWVQTAVIGTVAFGAALGPVAYAMGTIMRAGSGVISLFRMLVPAQIAASVSSGVASRGLLGFALAGISMPVAAIVGAVAAIGAAFVLVVPKIQKAIDMYGLWNTIKLGAISIAMGGGLGAFLSEVPGESKPGPAGRKKGALSLARRNDPVSQMIDQLDAAQRHQKELAKRRPDLAGPDMSGIGGSGVEKLTAAQRKAKQEAEQWAAFNDKITGKAAIDSAQEWMTHLSQVGGVTKITAAATEDLHKTLEEALDAYKLLGHTGPAAMNATWLATMKVVTITQGLGGGLDLPNQMSGNMGIPVAPMPVGVTQGLGGGLQLPNSIGSLGIPKAPGFLSSAFGGSEQFGQQFASTIMSAIQGGGSVFQSAGSFIGTSLMGQLGKVLTSGAGTAITGALGGAINAILPGIGALLGPLLGKIGGFLKGALGLGTAGRDDVKGFAESMGGFDALQKELNKLGAQGEKLWINLTQGVGRNNPEQAKAAIAAITTALANQPASMEQQASSAGFSTTAELQAAAAQAQSLYTFMRDSGQYSAEAVQAAWEKANAALIISGDQQALATQKATDAIAALDTQIKGLQASIANEAPEEVMGIVEAQTRAQIAALEEQKLVAVEAGAGVQAVIDGLNAQEVHIPVIFDIGPLPGGFLAETPDVPQMAAGGVVRARSGGTLVNVGEGGRDEAIVPLGQSTLGSGSGSGAREGVMLLDGDAVGRFVLPLMIAEAQRLGVA